ncbi:MAG: Na+/H+ antiporter subunit E [Deferrisomatales bacterium]|nr:Na+/H+ antiporter subunit E [Deferrisomatales bacterium]
MNPTHGGPAPGLRDRRVVAGAQAALLMGIWLLLSGLLDGFHVGLGVFSVVFVLWLDRRLPPMQSPGSPPAPDARARVLRFLAYHLWMPVQILISAVYVARIVLSPRMDIRPQMVRYRSAQPNGFAKMLLGNSITLTPGTLTVDVDGDRFLVHALTEDTAQGLLDGTMQTKVARLFQDEPGPMVFDVTVDAGGGEGQ